MKTENQKTDLELFSSIQSEIEYLRLMRIPLMALLWEMSELMLIENKGAKSEWDDDYKVCMATLRDLLVKLE